MTAVSELVGRAWPQANGLFRGTRWRGADDAYTIDLGIDAHGSCRSLWLFGDSFVADEDVDSRVGSHFIHNTVALQTGADPTTATIEFGWRTRGDGGPADYVPGRDADHYLWPYHGARLDDRVIVFFMQVGPPSGVTSEAGFWDEVPFTVDGWEAVVFSGVDDPLASWTVEPVVAVPATSRGVVGAAVLVDDGWLYAYSYEAGAALLTRTPADAAGRGDLTAMQWWTGGGWSAEPDQAVAVVTDAPTEFTVHRQAGRYCLVDVWPFGSPETHVNVRWADELTGPWTDREPVYLIPEAARDGVAAYAGKAHPELDGGGEGLVVTYASNTNGLGDQIWQDESIYYPQFVRAVV